MGDFLPSFFFSLLLFLHNLALSSTDSLPPELSSTECTRRALESLRLITSSLSFRTCIQSVTLHIRLTASSFSAHSSALLNRPPAMRGLHFVQFYLFLVLSFHVSSFSPPFFWLLTGKISSFSLFLIHFKNILFDD